MPEGVIVLDVWGNYAHFKKIYTTSSPLTYSFPPRTAISGLIGAIMGLDKKDYFRHFLRKDARIGCKIINPIKKIRIGENHLNADSIKNMHLIRNRHPTRREFVKDPKYRIYIAHLDDELYDNLKSLLINHQSIYTPCLGLSQLICNFRYVGEFDLVRLGEGPHAIGSVVPGKCIISPEFEERKEYFSETLPNEMNDGREVTDYSEILFERNGKQIIAKAKDIWEVENDEHERIAFL
ncbi:MAG: type I-B CRISPR-associated protein Cas5 [Methanothrix sp.]|jgi:CRISPR-associated protein Cas5h|uniref:type I-B CRISPR-associated protein Cas5b n=1 Tax=Methanothrix sp. TaxID=90426 RepID=UPI001B472AAA|nr:type I-B CRISPR-associated protein Cas5b [Methanothrix sp.]MBP7067747.1 type I-B CRISPR-associated protein Cas5 [Methanothrix sp.]